MNEAYCKPPGRRNFGAGFVQDASPPACASAMERLGNNKSQRAPRMPNQAVVKIGQDHWRVGIALSVQRQILRKRL